MKKRLLIVLCCLVFLLQLLPIVPMADTTGAAVVEKVKKVSQDLYYCRTELSKLPNGQKLVEVYDRIVNGIEICATEIKIELPEEEFKLVLDATRRDHTEQFWMGSSYTMLPSASDETMIMTMRPTYTMSGAELEDAITAFNQAVDSFLGRLTPGMSEYEMEKTLHDMLAANVDYVSSSKGSNTHNAYGALVEGKAVCEGYAESLQYLLQRAGIQAVEVFGYGVTDKGGENHAWNIVRIDGQYYLVDLTWNDQKNIISYAYFNQTSAYFDEDHIEWRVGYENGDAWKGGIDFPECTATAENYYIKNGLFIETYTVESIGKLLKENDLSVTLYLNTDIDAFVEWYGENYRSILHAAAGVYSGYKAFYTTLSKGEVNITFEGCSHRQTTLVPAKPATCEQDGNTAYYICKNEACGKWFSDVEAKHEILSRDTVKVYSIGHDWSVRDTESEDTLISRATNCQEYDTYWYVCAACQEMSDTYTFTTVAGEHVDEDQNGVCDLCRDGEKPPKAEGSFVLPFILGGGGGGILIAAAVWIFQKIKNGEFHF